LRRLRNARPIAMAEAKIESNVAPAFAPAFAPTVAPSLAPPLAPPPRAESLTLDDVAGLTADSDYSAFTAPGVDDRVRNQALRKLFLSDPHFQQSDGLDVAVDEVVLLAQSPLARQRMILQARALGLLDDEPLDQPEPDAEPPAA
jgi:hypothetical protein